MMKYILSMGLIFTFYLSLYSQSTDSDKFDEFDFWIGEWEVFNFGTDTLVGMSQIESILDGTSIRESYHSTRGNYKGTSLNKYNPQEKRWEQYWIDNSGLTLHILGGLKDGKMVMSNTVKQENGDLSNRITWQSLEDKSVRQTWDTSTDNGNSWQTVFDGHYKPKKSKKE